MKWIYKASALLVCVALFGIGAVMLFSAPDADGWKTVLTPDGLGRGNACIVAFACLLISSIFGLSASASKKTEKYLSTDTDGGVISVSAQAIAEYVAKIGAEFPAIAKTRARVKPGGGVVDLVVEVKVRAGSDIRETCSLIQKRIKDALVSGLGVNCVGKIDVIVDDIVADAVSGQLR